MMDTVKTVDHLTHDVQVRVKGSPTYSVVLECGPCEEVLHEEIVTKADVASGGTFHEDDLAEILANYGPFDTENPIVIPLQTLRETVEIQEVNTAIPSPTLNRFVRGIVEAVCEVDRLNILFKTSG